MTLRVLVTQSCPTLCDPGDCSLCPGNSPDKKTGMGSYSFLQGIFLTQRSILGLPHCRQILYHLSHQGSPIHLKHREAETQNGSRDKSSNLSLYTLSIVFFFFPAKISKLNS